MWEEEPVANAHLGEQGVLEHLVDAVAGGTKDGGWVLGEAVGFFLIEVDAAGNDAVEVTAGERRCVG